MCSEFALELTLKIPDLNPGVPVLCSFGYYSHLRPFRLDTCQTLSEIPTATEHGAWRGCILSPDTRLDAQLSPRHPVVAYAEDFYTSPTISILDPNSSWEPIAILSGHRSNIYCLDNVGPVDNPLLASGCNNGCVRLWDWKKAKTPCLRTFEFHSEQVYEICNVPRCNWLVSASADRSIRLCDLETGAQVGKCEHHSNMVFSIRVGLEEYSPYFLSCSFDQTLRMINMDGLECAKTFETRSSNRTLIQIPKYPHLVFVGSHGGWLSSFDFRMEGAAVNTVQLASQAPINHVVGVGAGLFASCACGGAERMIFFWNSDLEEVAHPDGEPIQMSSPDSTYGLVCFVPFRDDVGFLPVVK